MKNILYIGHYKDNSGLGESSRRYLNCLTNNTDYTITSKPLYLTQNLITQYDSSDQYMEYENNFSKTYDMIIQHTFPDYIEYHKLYGKNIAIPEIETSNIKHSGWVDRLNLMDEVWVGSRFSADSLISSGLRKPIKIIPEPYNIQEYTSQKDSFFNYDTNNRPFIFYTIGQYSEKKNIKSIILAYLLEFSSKDNVRLFIKTCDYRQKNNDLENHIEFDTLTIKNILRKPEDDYPDIDVLCGHLSKNDIIRLHQSSDCYVNCVKADSFGASAIEAALCDKIVINTKNIGSSTYFNSSNAFMVDSVESVVLCSNSPIKNAYTIHEKWFEPSIDKLKQAMRKAYELRDKQSLINNFPKQIFEHNTVYGDI